jgi:O-antigen/teichoic acid export membrane protein
VLKKFLPQSEFVKNVVTLMTGTTIAQAIPIAISPILTRLYSPADFGEFALFMSIVSVIAVVATARYELAIVLPKKDEDAANILALSFLISFLISLLTLVIVFLFNESIVQLLNNKELSRWLYFIPVTIFFMGIYQALNYWSTRKKTFKYNSISRISSSTATATTNLGMGSYSSGAGGLITGFVIGQAVGAIILGWKTISDFKKHKATITKTKMKENMLHYRNFAFINSPHALINSFQDSAIVFFITYYFATAIVGFYSFAFRILKAPVGLIGSALYQVFYQKASLTIHENGNLQSLFIKMIKRLTLIGLPIFTVLFFTAPFLFAFVFGKDWIVAGEIAQILIPWLFFNFLMSPVSCLPILLNKQKEAMMITLADITFRVIALVIGGIYNDYKLSFLIITVSCSLLLIFAMLWYYKISGIKTLDKSYA